MGSAPAPSGVGPSATEPPPGGGGDHGAVVGAELHGAGRKTRRPACCGRLRHPRPQPGVRRHPAADREDRRADVVGRGEELVDELVDHRLLERRGHVGDARVPGVLRTWFTTAVFRPGEREVGLAAASHAGSAPRPASPAVARRSIAGPARIAEPEEARDLVERLARGVVDGLAHDPVPAVVLHHDDHGVAAGHDQHASGGSRSGSSSHAA